MTWYTAKIQFLQNDESYVTIQTRDHDIPCDMVLNAIFNLFAILEMGEHKFDDEIIERLKFRSEELKTK